MSLLKPVLNTCLRLIEKPHLARATSVPALRASFERKAKLLSLAAFRGPRRRRKKKNDIQGLWIESTNALAKKRPLLLYFHGGAYIMGSPRTHYAMLLKLSNLTGLHAWLPWYRLAPENPFPAAFEDALKAYEAVVERPGGVIIGGDSAGGGLAFALLAEIQKRGLRQPRGLFALSPFTDMTFSGDSILGNAKTEAILPHSRLNECVSFYLQDADPKNPRASPLFANFQTPPPVWLCASSTEMLLDDTTRMTEKLERQGGDVTSVIENDLPHVWPLFHMILPEARATLRQLADWIYTLHAHSVDS